MTRNVAPFAIRVSERDPARDQIGEDLAACGGVRAAGPGLLYGFRSQKRRDEALRAIRGSFGCLSVEPADRAEIRPERAGPPSRAPEGHGAGPPRILSARDLAGGASTHGPGVALRAAVP